MTFRTTSILIGFTAALAACSSSSSPAGAPDTTPDSSAAATVTGYTIVSTGGGALTAVAGDALTLKVMQTMSDGTTQALASTTTVTWTTPTSIAALDPDSTADSPLPAPGAAPTGTFVTNPGRPDRAADLTGVLFVLDAGTAGGGTLAVAATIAGGGATGQAAANVTVSTTPAGDATRGAMVYGAAGANCADCHGATGHGTDPMTSADGGMTYLVGGRTFDYPAPGLNAEPGNCGSDPAWNAALFAFAARSDIDNGGLTLREPMPDWLADPSSATNAPPTTQDLADIFAFMKTQSQ